MNRRIEQLLDLITLLKRKRFGRSADVVSPDQRSLVDEAEFEALIDELEAEQLAVIPHHPYVIRVKRAKYAPVDDSILGAEQGVVIAPRAPQILPKAIAHSSLLADVVVGKFVDALCFDSWDALMAFMIEKRGRALLPPAYRTDPRPPPCLGAGQGVGDAGCPIGDHLIVLQPLRSNSVTHPVTCPGQDPRLSRFLRHI